MIKIDEVKIGEKIWINPSDLSQYTDPHGRQLFYMLKSASSVSLEEKGELGFTRQGVCSVAENGSKSIFLIFEPEQAEIAKIALTERQPEPGSFIVITSSVDSDIFLGEMKELANCPLESISPVVIGTDPYNFIVPLYKRVLPIFQEHLNAWIKEGLDHDAMIAKVDAIIRGSHPVPELAGFPYSRYIASRGEADSLDTLIRKILHYRIRGRETIQEGKEEFAKSKEIDFGDSENMEKLGIPFSHDMSKIRWRDKDGITCQEEEIQEICFSHPLQEFGDRDMAKAIDRWTLSQKVLHLADKLINSYGDNYYLDLESLQMEQYNDKKVRLFMSIGGLEFMAPIDFPINKGDGDFLSGSSFKIAFQSQLWLKTAQYCYLLRQQERNNNHTSKFIKEYGNVHNPWGIYRSGMIVFRRMPREIYDIAQKYIAEADIIRLNTIIRTLNEIKEEGEARRILLSSLGHDQALVDRYMKFFHLELEQSSIVPLA